MQGPSSSNGNRLWMWAVGILVGLFMSGLGAFAYLNATHVGQSEFKGFKDEVLRSLVRIEGKIDRVPPNDRR